MTNCRVFNQDTVLVLEIFASLFFITFLGQFNVANSIGTHPVTEVIKTLAFEIREIY